MKRNPEVQPGTGTMLGHSLAIAACLGLTAPLVLAQSPAARTPTVEATAPTATQPAQKCASDLRAFDGAMQKEGYWLHGSGYGYGYPLYGYGFGHGYGDLGGMGTGAVAPLIGHGRVRPGYEIRTLIASANILAESGQQQACDAVLTAAREAYKGYAAELTKSGVTRADGTTWRRQQIAAAKPVGGAGTPYRTDQLIGADVVNLKGDDLGSVSDIVLSPQTGKFAYLVVGRGGVFGIGEKYVPVPWDHFKATAGANFLVLDTTKTSLDGAPRVKSSHPSAAYDNFAEQTQKVDVYWKAHVMN